jgi:predicted 3-demethylubiquinone-9 3-methyltransferase (glyoxalase superfamily)
MQKMSTCLWFDTEGEEAVKFYTSIFKDSKIGRILRSDAAFAASAEASGVPAEEIAEAGSVLTIEFELNGQQFTALNGGPMFKFNESVSLVVNCDSQEEVDYYWNALTANGGAESMCGWLKDKFGLSWQITPTRLIDLVNDKDPAKAHRAFQAMLQMRKIDIQRIEDAANGK